MIQEEINKTLDGMQAQIDRVKKDVSGMTPIDHLHNGFDSTKITYSDIFQRKIWVHHTVVGADAATAANYAVFFIAPFACVLNEFRVVFQTAGTDAGAVTLDLEKLTGTQALDAGVSMLASTINLKGAINTVNTATITTTGANRSIARGDRIALDDSGTLTSCANVSVTAEFIIS